MPGGQQAQGQQRFPQQPFMGAPGAQMGPAQQQQMFMQQQQQMPGGGQGHFNNQRGGMGNQPYRQKQ